MANEVYKLSLLLESKNENPGVIQNFVNDLVKLRNESKLTKSAYDGLLKSLNRPIADKSGSKLLQTLSSIEKESKKAGSQLGWLKNKADNLQQSTGGANKLASAIGNIEKQAGTALSKIDRLNNNSKGLGGSLPSRSGGRRGGNSEIDKLFENEENERRKNSFVGRIANFNDRYLEPVRQTADIWRREADSLRVYKDAVLDVSRAQEQFKLLNPSAADSQKAATTIQQIVNSTRGITTAAATENMTDVFNAFGDMDKAVKAMPFASKFTVGFKMMHGGRMGEAEISEQTQKAFKALEVSGRTSSLERTIEGLDIITKITNASGGRVKPSEIYQFFKYGGPTAQNMSKEGIFNMSTILSEMGGSTTGTALTSLSQALVSGRMSQKSIDRLIDLGLVDKNKLDWSRAKKPMLQPGAIELGRLLQDNPLAAADRLAEAFRGKGIDTSSEKAVSEQLGVIFQNRNAERLITMLINQRDQVLKEAKVTTNAKGNEATYSQALESDAGKIIEFEAALTNFRAKAGVPLVKTLTDLAQAATPVMKFFGDHPTVTKWTMGMLLAGKAVNALSQTASVFSNTGSGLLSFLSRTKTSADAAGNSVAAAGNKIGGLSNKLKGLPGEVKLGISIAAIGFTWEQVDKLFELHKQNQKTNKGLESVGKSQSTGFAGTLDMIRNEGKNPDRSLYNDQAGSVLQLLQSGGNKNLEYGLAPERQGWYERFYTSMWNPFNYHPDVPAGSIINPEKRKRMNEVSQYPQDLKTRLGIDSFNLAGFVAQELAAVKHLQKTTPALNNPDILASFRNTVPSTLNLNDTMKARLEEWLKQAFPSSFDASTGILQQVKNEQLQAFARYVDGVNSYAEQFKQQQQQTQTVVQGLTNLETPINSTYQSFSKLPTPTDQTGESFLRLIGSANGVIGGLDNVSAKLHAWQPPQAQPVQIPVFSGGGQQPGGSLLPSILRKDGGKASGGSVFSGGWAFIHQGEDIIPAVTAKEYREPSTFAELRKPKEKKPGVFGFIDELLDSSRKQKAEEIISAEESKSVSVSVDASSNAKAERSSTARTSRPNISITSSPIIHINGDSASAKIDFRRELQKHSKDILRMIEEVYDIGEETD